MITTKKGDLGRTICGNRRVDKDNLLVEVVGEIDELQAVLEVVGNLDEITDTLSKIMGELGSGIKFDNYILEVEKMEVEINKENFKLDHFLKFENEKSAKINWARTVCRRVERRIVSLSKQQKVDEIILKYFNRLSDYLFIKAIKEN